MNLGVTGATGFIGRALIDHALRRSHEVTSFTRHPERAIPGCTMRKFALDEPPDLAGCEAIIHLAGEPVVGVWTPAKKRRIRDSRVLGTRNLVAAINALAVKPEVLVCGSAIGFYGDAGESDLTEDSPAGSGFLAETVAAWEAEAEQAEGVRVVRLRTGLVLGHDGGMLRALIPVIRCGLGATLGSGRQWMPWIHLEDEVRLALFAVENLEVRGALNASAPWPARNADFTAMLAARLRRGAFWRVPAFAIRLLGDFSHELLDSKRVLPARALDHGFGFNFPELEPALRHLIG